MGISCCDKCTTGALAFLSLILIQEDANPEGILAFIWISLAAMEAQHRHAGGAGIFQLGEDAGLDL